MPSHLTLLLDGALFYIGRRKDRTLAFLPRVFGTVLSAICVEETWQSLQSNMHSQKYANCMLLGWSGHSEVILVLRPYS